MTRIHGAPDRPPTELCHRGVFSSHTRGAYDSSMTSTRVYLDYAASAPMLPEAREAMLEALAMPAGNSSSPHTEGRAHKDLLEAARTRTAKALGCRPREIVFTSGGTEAAHIALHGAAQARRETSRRIVVSAVEHPAVMEAAEQLAEAGFELVRVPVDAHGVVSSAQFLDVVGEDAAVAAIMAANHETGAVMPVREVAAGLRERGIPLLCDAALAPGRISVETSALGADLVAFAGHKFGAPVGSGALYVRRGVTLERWMTGGLQEERLRAGTENVAACVALSVALHHACRTWEANATNCDALIGQMLSHMAELDDWRVIGPQENRLPGLVTLEFPGVEGEAAMINMDLAGFAVATGSTCALGSTDPSPGLLAMGLSRTRAASTLRISIGNRTNANDIEGAASSLCAIVLRLRSLARR